MSDKMKSSRQSAFPVQSNDQHNRFDLSLSTADTIWQPAHGHRKSIEHAVGSADASTKLFLLLLKFFEKH